MPDNTHPAHLLDGEGGLYGLALRSGLAWSCIDVRVCVATAYLLQSCASFLDVFVWRALVDACKSTLAAVVLLLAWFSSETRKPPRATVQCARRPKRATRAVGTGAVSASGGEGGTCAIKREREGGRERVCNLPTRVCGLYIGKKAAAATTGDLYMCILSKFGGSTVHLLWFLGCGWRGDHQTTKSWRLKRRRREQSSSVSLCRFRVCIGTTYTQCEFVCVHQEFIGNLLEVTVYRLLSFSFPSSLFLPLMPMLLIAVLLALGGIVIRGNGPPQIRLEILEPCLDEKLRQLFLNALVECLQEPYHPTLASASITRALTK